MKRQMYGLLEGWKQTWVDLWFEEARLWEFIVLLGIALTYPAVFCGYWLYLEWAERAGPKN